MPDVPDQGLRFLDALPNYLGSKRQQSAAIFRAIEAAGFGPRGRHTLVDPFMGGGSISLTAKALGYRVLANDVSPRSEAIGKALIENKSTRLTEEDVALCLTTDPTGWYLPPLKQLPWPDDSRFLLAAIAKGAESFEQPMKRHIARAWLVKFATAISIYGQPRMTVHERIRNKNWDALSPGMVDRILEPQTQPRRMATAAARQINEAVFSNGERNFMCRHDALDFLQANLGDVVYLDPPYPDTEGYGRNYVGIDAILENRELDIDEGRFAAADGWRYLDDIIAAADRAPLVVLSLGAEVKHVGLDDLKGIFENNGRYVEATELDYGLLRSRATAKSDGKREYLIVGAKAPLPTA
jgi:hypothetical protein